MGKICFSLLLTLLYSINTLAQGDIATRVILIGNMREAVKDNSNFLEVVKENVRIDSNTIVLYLGNNALTPYDTSALSAAARIAGRSGGKVFFIPGYRDWANGKEEGYKAILAQQRFIESLQNKNIKFYPRHGCPGPKKIDLGNDAEMLIMDSQWWLHEHSKPDIESGCKYRTKEEILAEIEDFPKNKRDKLILFVAHHPVKSTGIHSGTFALKQHIFPLTDLRNRTSFYLPLPVIGSLYPVARNVILSKQDMNNPAYKSFSETGIGSLPGIVAAFKDHPNTIFISGQEHNLQLLNDGRHRYINSGAAGGGGRVRNTASVDYVSEKKGYAVLEIYKDKKVKARFFEVTKTSVYESYAASLAHYAEVPPLARDTATMPMITTDSTIARASEKIGGAKGLKHFLIGENYREEWDAPVKMKVLHMGREKGGLKITGAGGGHESMSLQLEDTAGKKWVLRSTNKNLEAVIPEGFQQTIASDYIHDMLSGVNPYGALVVPGLLRPLNIVHASPQVYFVPNDTALGMYRPIFANTVAQLEERKPALNKNKLLSTTEALNEMVENSDHLSDQRNYLKIRLVDFLIADFDRHHGQYSWGTIDTANRKLYYPVPKDRDQALYNNTGLLISIARWYSYKFMVNFPGTIKNMKNMGIVGAYMDGLFLNRLTEADWRSTIAEFRTTLSDTVIQGAVQNLPPEIYKIRGDKISRRLISRRNDIAGKSLQYYRFIAKRVSVPGGHKDEVFRISGNDSGLLVQVYARNSNGDNELKYSRNFDPAVTKEIRLFGFSGNDRFDVDRSARSGIRLKIVGGKGDDTFNIHGKIKNHIYDIKKEDNIVLSRSRTTKMFSPQSSANEYIFREPVRSSFYFPLVAFGFSADDGVLAGVGASYKTYGFRKYPYATRQSLSTLFALTKKAYQVRYNGEFINVLRQYDLLVNAEMFNPVLNNFFGFGNATVRDPAKQVEYYRTRYDYVAADVLVRQRFLNKNIMSIAAGPTVYRYWNDPEPHRFRILEFPSLVGLDSTSVFSPKFYAGGKAVLTVNNLDNEMLPMRGVNWTTDFTALQAMNNNSVPFTRVLSTIDIYAVLSEPARLLTALHFGGGHIFSNNFEYFQALTLGGNNYLRGFRTSRFSGSSMAYGSVEMKVKLFDFNAYIIKGDLGLVGFNDLGRVWMNNEQSKKWHHGYGGGIYLIPFDALMVSAIVARSEEEVLFNLTIGTKLNMVFQGR